MRKFALILALLPYQAVAQELCTGGPCTANGGTEFSVAAAQNGSKGQVEIDGPVTPNGTGNPTGLRMIWNMAATGTGVPQGVVNYSYGNSGSNQTINEYSQNDNTSTSQAFMGGNSILRGGSFGSTVGYNHAIAVETSGSSTLNATIVARATGSSAADNVAGTFLVTNGGGSGKAVALYAGSGSAKPTYLGNVVAQFNSLAINPLDVAAFQVDDATVLRVRRDRALQFVDQGTKPTCDAAHRGSFWYDAGATGVADALEACTKDATDAYSWVSLQ